MRFVRLLWITTRPGRAWVGSVTNKHNPSTESGLGACISSRITTVIHVRNDHQINCNCFNEPFAVLPYRSLYWDMHGLIFETSIWLLAGSTRLVNEPLNRCTDALGNPKPFNHNQFSDYQTEVSRDLALNTNRHRMPSSWTNVLAPGGMRTKSTRDVTNQFPYRPRSGIQRCFPINRTIPKG
jgi:hypothetical protein